MRSYLLIMSLMLSFTYCFTSTAHAEPVLSLSGKYTIDYDLRIKVGEDRQGSPIEVEAFLRKPVTEGVLFPTVIFITSWATPLIEYDLFASRLADQGYAVVTYTPRGFWGSDGSLGTASPQDTADANTVIDWLISNNIANPDAIALAGVSYGAGIGFHTVANNPKVRAFISLSGWANLADSLVPNLTPRLDWINLLNGFGYLTSAERDFIGGFLLGAFPDDIQTNLNRLYAQEDLPAVFDWANARSAETYWDGVADRKNQPAIYVVNNLQDYLFQPDTTIRLLKRHSGPWRLDLNFGTHGVPEVVAQANPFDYTWDNIKNWLDHYLKGEENYVQCLKPVNWVVHDRIDDIGLRESLDAFEDENESTQTTYYFQPGSENNAGLLSTSPFAGSATLSYSTTETVITTGSIPDQLLGHRTWNIGDIENGNAVVFTSPILSENLNLRGSAKVSFYADIQKASQFFVYLLAMDPETKQADFLSHAPYSFFSAVEGEEIEAGISKVEFDLIWASHDIPAGKQIVVVIDGQDPDYLRGNETPDTNTLVLDSNRTASITLPSIAQPQPLFTLRNMTAAQKSNCADDNPSDLNLGQVRSNEATTGSPSNNTSTVVNNTPTMTNDSNPQLNTFSNGGGSVNAYFFFIIGLLLSLKKVYLRVNLAKK